MLSRSSLSASSLLSSPQHLLLRASYRLLRTLARSLANGALSVPKLCALYQAVHSHNLALLRLFRGSTSALLEASAKSSTGLANRPHNSMIPPFLSDVIFCNSIMHVNSSCTVAAYTAQLQRCIVLRPHLQQRGLPSFTNPST